MEKNSNSEVATEEVKSLCPAGPDKPVRVGGRVYCESTDPDEGREYAALIHVVNSIEDIVLDGGFFDPFDGSSVEYTNPVSVNDYYLCRSYCSEVGDYQNAIEDGGPTLVPESVEKEMRRMAELKLPKPPTPLLDEGDSRPNHVAIYFEESEEWKAGLAELEEQGVKVERVRLTRYILVGRGPDGKPKWQKLKKGQGNKENKEFIFSGKGPGDLFSRYPKLDHTLVRSKTYGYIAEVLFLFSTGKNGSKCIRGVHSDPLIIEGNTGKPPRNP